MKPDILLTGPLLDSVMDSLAERYTVHRLWEHSGQDALFDKLSPVLSAVVTDGALGASRELLEKLPAVKAVIVYGVGVDSVDLAYCNAHNIAVSNTPDVLSDDVADMGVALMLACARQMISADRYCRSGRWPQHGALALTHRMNGKRVGIFGMGSIGMRLARRLEAFNMDIYYCNRNKRTDANYRYFPDLLKMAGEVDYLVVTASASAATRHSIDAGVLAAIGAEGFLINVSRGSLVDEAALISALQNGTIRAAGLDVFEDEPRIPEAFFSMDNVVLQPHHASGTIETRRAMGQVVLDNLQAFFSGNRLPTQYFAAS